MENNRFNLDNLEEVKKFLEIMSGLIQTVIPEDYGFVLLTYPHDSSEGRLYYSSNSKREDVTRAMAEFIEKTKDCYGKHDGLED